MKVIFAALSAFALVGHAQVYDRNRSVGEEWQQQRESAEMRSIEQAAKQRESEYQNRIEQLERQQKIQQQEYERRQRQLELEQLRLWLWSR